MRLPLSVKSIIFALFSSVCFPQAATPQSPPRAKGSDWQASIHAAAQAKEKGDLEKAEKILSAELEQIEDADFNEQRLIQTLDRLGKVYQEEHKYDEALNIYSLEVQLWDRSLGLSDVIAAGGYLKLARVYGDLNQNDDAERNYKRSLAILERAPNPAGLITAQCLESYAALLRKLDRAPEAMEMESRARKIRAALPSPR